MSWAWPVPKALFSSAVIFNALIIVALIPLALKGVPYRAVGAAAALQRNLLVYGLGGLVAPFIGIKLIDLLYPFSILPNSMKAIVTELRSALIATIVLAVVTCGFYPLLVTGITQIVFPDQARGSLITPERMVQSWDPGCSAKPLSMRTVFHPRPSAAGSGYDAASSSGSNLGPTSQKLHDQIKERIDAYRSTNGLAADTTVPADAVTASASGLDPHISLRNAKLQAPRVAKERNLDLEQVQQMIAECTDKPDFGLLGMPGVNVLQLNLKLASLKSGSYHGRRLPS